MVANRFSVFSIFKYLFLLIIAFTIIYPLLHILSVSLSSNTAIMTNAVTFYPIGLNLSAYRIIWDNTGLLAAYGNTLQYVVFGTLIAMFVTTCGAYALSKGKRLWGFKFFTAMIVLTMFFNGGLIPTYLTIKNYGLINTTFIVISLDACSAWNLIVMKSFFQSMPKDLEDAGKIDGLNDFGTLWFIIIPLSTAIITTIALFYAVGFWNAYFTPFIYLNEPAKYPVQIILKQLLLAGTNKSQEAASSMGDALIMGESMVNAVIIVSIIPIIAIYPFLQKYFVKGIMIGSLKG